eukprot:scaffold60334_cov67-Phaeocystis_antarctica.AAC.3
MSMTWSSLPSDTSGTPSSSSTTKALPCAAVTAWGFRNRPAAILRRNRPSRSSSRSPSLFDVADGFVDIIKFVRDNICAFDCGDDLQVCVKDDQRLASFIGSDSIGPLSLLMHCTSRESSFIVGKRRHRRQLIHRAVLSEFDQRGGRAGEAASQEPIVGERQARETLETPCGETAGPAGRQRLWVGIVARSDELYAAIAVKVGRGDRQHSAR